MSATQLIGTWALIATQWRRADGRHANPFGEGAVGILIYDAEGNMSAQIMHAARPAPPAGEPDGIDTAMAAAVPGYVAYFGEYAVDEARGEVTHRVIGATYPTWAGREITRGYRLESDTLTLTDSVTARDGVTVEAATTWRRIG